MSTITIGKDGVEFIHTNVIVPRNLRDFAKAKGVSMSFELRKALEKKMNKGNTEAQQLPTNSVSVLPSSTRDEVDV